MRVLEQLWSDESGMIVSAEAVTVGTVAVLGATAGLSTASTALNEELLDVARAIRSLDQSYSVPGRQSGRAWTSGSSYLQQSVEKSLQDLVGPPGDPEEQDPPEQDSDSQKASETEPLETRAGDDLASRSA